MDEHPIRSVRLTDSSVVAMTDRNHPPGQSERLL